MSCFCTFTVQPKNILYFFLSLALITQTSCIGGKPNKENYIDLNTLPSRAEQEEKAQSLRFTPEEQAKRRALMQEKADDLQTEGEALWEKAFGGKRLTENPAKQEAETNA